MPAQSISGFGGARRAHGVRTDEMWAVKQRKNVDAFRAIYGHDVRVHDAPRRSRRHIYANDGRWVLDCDCHAGVIVDLTWGIARCHECGAIYRRHNLLIPSNAMEIETALLTLYPQRRQSALRDWRPGQTLDDLKGRHFSWTTPRTWVTGEVVTASIGNIHWRDNLNELRAGGLALASQAALDFVYADSATQLARLAKGSGLQAPRLNSGATAYEFFTPVSGTVTSVGLTMPTGFSVSGSPVTSSGTLAVSGGPCTLLKANSGTTTTSSGEDVDTYAMASGLTAKDTVVVMTNVQSDTQQTAGIILRQTNDNRTMSPSVTLAANQRLFGLTMLRQGQAAATDVFGLSFWRDSVPTDQSNMVYDNAWVVAWTGAWTLALRHGGVTASGTLKWSWAVFKLAGQ